MNIEKGSTQEAIINHKAIHLLVDAIKASPHVVKPTLNLDEFADQLMAGAKKLIDNNFIIL
jgi:hypothetical protein